MALESELQVSEGSRAIVFTRRSMEILQQVGVAERVSEAGLPWGCGNSFYRNQLVFRMETPQDPDDRYAPMTNLQQPYLEQFLAEAAEANPLVEIRWGNRATALEQQADFARLEIDTPTGSYHLDADWVVAAYGARSAIRSLLDLKLEGASYEGHFVIADIKIDLGLPTERLAYFDPVWNPGNTVLMHREPGNIWRIDYQLPANETPEQALQPESLRERINAQLEMVGVKDPQWEMDWSSVYSARALTLPQYIHNRVIFTGDAAHLLPIFGVRGANTGFQDCHDLVWKLALTIKGLAGSKLLGSYTEERAPAAREIISEAGKSTRFMAPPNRCSTARLTTMIVSVQVHATAHRCSTSNWPKTTTCSTALALPSISSTSPMARPFQTISLFAAAACHSRSSLLHKTCRPASVVQTN